MKKISKILIANRGEIAIRVMRTAKEMGIKTVAVFSEADRNALHVRYADEAVCIGAPPSNQSYLLGDKIIAFAKSLNVDAIHPGYGFLSENAAFSKAVADAGMIFIGPSEASILSMGSKIAAKETAKKYNVPLVPGTEDAVLTSDDALKISKQIGFPVLIKASAGGGGKGMRAVYKEEELVEQYEMAKSEARNSFGDDAVMIEKYVTAPRHIEIQVLCDNHGNGVYLFERECSIQRRHQKLVEEAPSACLTPEVRKAMGECAVRLATESKYSGAGTVEFLVDDKLNFYFLEMNTRLQVEHPVSEIICGLDLVKEQIKVAMDLPLSFTQNDLKINGHSIELRVCAEDPMNNFLPDIGKLVRYEKPNGTGVRVDDAYEQGMDIPIYYDPMIAKLIVHGATREEAMDRLCRAIDEYKITGIQTTLQFGKWVVQHPEFRKGNITTNFIAQYFKPEYLKTTDENEANIAALVAAHFFDTITSAASNASPVAALTTEKHEWRKRRGMR
ncbi:MAG: acetyl-CoA carboxylase biotin carboxylase subunit [Bacteroidota bacterium]